MDCLTPFYQVLCFYDYFRSSPLLGVHFIELGVLPQHLFFNFFWETFFLSILFLPAYCTFKDSQNSPIGVQNGRLWTPSFLKPDSLRYHRILRYFRIWKSEIILFSDFIAQFSTPWKKIANAVVVDSVRLVLLLASCAICRHFRRLASVSWCYNIANIICCYKLQTFPTTDPGP